MTDQAPTSPPTEQLDPIVVLMGHIPEAELDLRRKLMVAGRLAQAIPYQTESKTARIVCSEVCDLVRQWQFAPAPIERLDSVVRLVRRLVICANNAQMLEADA